MTSQAITPVWLPILEHLREVVVRASSDRSYVCGLIRGLDISVETFTRASGQLDPEQLVKQLDYRASRIESRDDYHNGCAAAMRLAGDLLVEHDEARL